MTTLQDREKALEGIFAREAEMTFKAYARRNWAAAEWASALRDAPEGAAQAYALELIHIDIEDPSHEASLRKLIADLEGIVGETLIREKMSELLLEAMDDLSKA